jgi:hypothetical protein
LLLGPGQVFCVNLVDTLGLPRVVATVTGLAAAGAQPDAQFLLGGGKVWEGLGGIDRPLLQGGSGRCFGHVAGRDAGMVVGESSSGGPRGRSLRSQFVILNLPPPRA